MKYITNDECHSVLSTVGSIGIERLVKGEIKMTHTIKNFDEAYDEIRDNEEYNKRFLSEAEKELKQIKDTNGHITDSDIAKVLVTHDGTELTVLGSYKETLSKINGGK